MGREDGTQAAVAGCLGRQAEGRASEQDRVPCGVVVVTGHDNGMLRLDRLGEERPDRVGAKSGLVAEDDQRRGGGRRDRREPDRQRARQAPCGIGVPDAALAAPGNRLLDCRGFVAENDHDLSDALPIERVEHVLQHGPAAQLGEQLHAAEARSGPGCENDRADRRGFGSPGHPPVIGVGSRISRIGRSAARSRIGRPLPR